MVTRLLGIEKSAVSFFGNLLVLAAVGAVRPIAEPVDKVRCLHTALLLEGSQAFTLTVAALRLRPAGPDTTKRADEKGGQAHLAALVVKGQVNCEEGWVLPGKGCDGGGAWRLLRGFKVIEEGRAEGTCNKQRGRELCTQRWDLSLVV